jgi:hypothetical protein
MTTRQGRSQRFAPMIRAIPLRHTSVLRPDAEARIVLARGDAEVASWPLIRPERTGLELIDALARLQLTAQRIGCSLHVRDGWAALVELLDLAGLAELVACSGLEAGGKAEGREQLGVQEVVQPGDPSA